LFLKLKINRKGQKLLTSVHCKLGKVTHTAKYFKDDFTDFIQLQSWFTANLFMSLPNYQVDQYKAYLWIHLRHVFNIKKTRFWKRIQPQSRVLNVEFGIKLRIYRSLRSSVCLKWILKKLSTILFTQFNYLSQPVCPFDTKR